MMKMVFIIKIKGNHLIASSNNENNELFDISLLNECMSIKYSAK